MEFYLEIKEYIYEIVEGGGAILVVHDQHEVPLPEQAGILIAPGFETRIGITRVRFQLFIINHKQAILFLQIQNRVFLDQQINFLMLKKNSKDKG